MGKFNQFLTAFAASFGQILMGSLNVWPSYTLSLYTSNSTMLDEPMNEDTSSFLGSVPSLGAMAGTAVAGYCLDKLGRKYGGIVLTLPAVISWTIIGMTYSTIPILVARFLGGVSGGALLVYAPTFISETAEDSIRGMLASGPVTGYCLGAMLSYLMGWFSDYHTIIWLNVTLAVGSMLFVMMVTESPVYLIRQNRDEDARKAIASYRNGDPTSKVVLEEFSRLKQLLVPASELVAVKTSEPDEKQELEKEQLQGDEDADVPVQNVSSIRLLFSSASSRMAFSIIMFIGSAQVLMGMVSVQVYAKNLFSQVAPSLSSHFCSVLLALVMLLGTFVTAAFADKAGRRVLEITSAVLVGVCMLSLGLFLQTGIAPPWVTAMVVLIYCFSFTLGVGTVPYVLLAEVFVPEVQNIVSMIFIEWMWLLNFALIAVFPKLVSLFGIHIVFYMFGVIASCTAVACYFILPETKGLSNKQIQDVFLRIRRK